MPKKHGRSRPPRTCPLAVEWLEGRCLPSALGSVPAQALSAGLVRSAHHGGRTAPGAAARAASTAADRSPGRAARSGGEAGGAQEGGQGAGAGNTDPSGSGGQQGPQGGTEENQSGPQQGDSQPGGFPVPPEPATSAAVDNPGAGPAQDQAAEVPMPTDPSADNGPDVPPAASRVVVAATPGAERAETFSTQASVAQGSSPPVPQGEAGEIGPAAPGSSVEPSPQAAGVGLAEHVAPRRQGGGTAPESSPQEAPVPRLAGELREALVVDAAVLERGLRRFLDQLGALGTPGPGQKPGPVSWLERVPALLPWLGMATAAAAALELARRRLRPLHEGAFAGPEDGSRWVWGIGLPGPLPDEEP
jgi:hypothetical protein